MAAPRCALLLLASAAAAAASPNATVTVAWTSVVRQLKTVPAFQTVVNSLTTRVAPQHDAIFEAIARLNASYQRFVPWLPYPRLGVAELEPPSGSNLCGFANGAADPAFPSAATLDCRGHGTIADVSFASFGTPSGFCGALAKGACDAPSSLAVAQALCVGKASCVVPSSVAAFGGTDPCPGTAKRLALQATCSEPGSFTYWSFAAPDESMIDFMVASGNGARTAIPNFSTPPQWLYSTPRVLYVSADDGGSHPPSPRRAPKRLRPHRDHPHAPRQSRSPTTRSSASGRTSQATRSSIPRQPPSANTTAGSSRTISSQAAAPTSTATRCRPPPEAPTRSRTGRS